MANSITGRTLTIGTTLRTFTDLLGLTRGLSFRDIDTRAAEGQSGTIFFTTPGGEKFAYILAGDAFTIPGPVNTDDIAALGSAAGQTFYLVGKET